MSLKVDKAWKKGVHAFLIIRDIQEVLEAVLEVRCFNPNYWKVKILHPSKKYRDFSYYNYCRNEFREDCFYSSKLEALKDCRDITAIYIEEDKEDIKEIQARLNEKQKILKRISRQISKEEKKCV